MRSRCLLHRTTLDDFAQWCAANGWKVTKPKADFQVLRVDYGAKEPAIIYDRHEGDHLTVFGPSLKLVNQYLDNRKG